MPDLGTDHRSPHRSTLPAPRGPLGRTLDAALRRGTPLPDVVPLADGRADAALAQWVLHELPGRGFADVDDAAAERLDLLALRQRLDADLERAWWLRAARLVPRPVAPADVPDAVRAVCEADLGPGVADHVRRGADLDDVRFLVAQRSVYHQREQDPAMPVLTRLPDDTKAHLVAVAADEYGNGRPERLHARLWAEGAASLGLATAYGAHVDGALTEVLEQNNLMSLLGAAPRLTGAALGHLAAFEVTSSLPSRAMATGLARAGAPAALVGYYEEHAVADAVHEHVAVDDVLGSYLEHRPDQATSVVVGAALCVLAEAATAQALLAALPSARAAATEAVA